MVFLWMLTLPLLAAGSRYHVAQGDGLVTLRDEVAGVEARISPREGGELCGLRYRLDKQWVELLYKACDYSKTPGWRGKAPLLFPATGSTAAPYPAMGKSFKMIQHGFAQHLPWKLDVIKADANEARALLSITDTAQTRPSYPFGFRVSVEYRLRDGRLYMVYTVGAAVENREPMPFSIGNHITFRTPLVPGSDPRKVRLETPARVLIKKDAKNIPTGETAAPPFTNTTDLGAIPFNPAVSLGGYEGAPVLTLTDPTGLRIRMRHEASRTPKSTPYVQFNVWGDPANGYISPEPWVGLQNSLLSRKGLIELRPGETWDWRVELHPHKLVSR
jgi:galactose mutarotase-like enzyme